MCERLLWSKVAVPREQLHPVPLPSGSETPIAQVSLALTHRVPSQASAQIAEAYERELVETFSGSFDGPPAFDLVLLTLGALFIDGVLRSRPDAAHRLRRLRCVGCPLFAA
jgi:hypothetical protein